MAILSYEFIEGGTSNIGKNGVMQTDDLMEYKLNLQYDDRIYVESDGTMWLHIFHHNNPTSYKFASNNDFVNGCYIDANRWFNINVCKNLKSWEFIYQQSTTADGGITKYRWIQSKSPYTASYSDVAPGTVTRVTTSGYTNGGNGGLYIVNSGTYMVVANSSNGNWFGATGCWDSYNGGIPGYPNTTVTTGCIDIFVRIDNALSVQSALTEIGDTFIESPNFIEI